MIFSKINFVVLKRTAFVFIVNRKLRNNKNYIKITIFDSKMLKVVSWIFLKH